MKNNRILICLTLFLIFMFVVLCIVSLLGDYQMIVVEGNRYYVQVPENYTGGAYCMYNNEFLEQKNQDGVIQFTFINNGYYQVRIAKNKYVFAVNVNSEGDANYNKYQKQLRDIEHNNFESNLVLALILMMLVISVFIVLLKIKQCKNTKQK